MRSQLGILVPLTLQTRGETRLEQLEACDSNRILDMSFRQYIANYPAIKSFSVDSPEDICLVEDEMKNEDLWRLYE